MPRRFQAEIDRLNLQATTAAWRITMSEVYDLLAQLDAALASLSCAAAPAGTDFAQGFIEMRHALDRDLRALEAAMAEAQAKLACLEAP